MSTEWNTEPSTGTSDTPRRTTRQRTAVLEALQSTQEFQGAQQLHDQLRHSGASVGLATVYRTLQAMADAGEVDSMRTDEGEVRYRLCSTPTHHHHLVCTTCGRTVELEARPVEEWTATVAHQHGFAIDGHVLELYGRCADCRGSD